MRTYPYLGEPYLPYLGKSFYTPNELFYVRNHFPVPEFIDTKENIDNYTIEIYLNGDYKYDDIISNWDGDNENIKYDYSFNLSELKDPTKFKQLEYSATLQCSGNRLIN